MKHFHGEMGESEVPEERHQSNDFFTDRLGVVVLSEEQNPPTRNHTLVINDTPVSQKHLRGRSHASTMFLLSVDGA